MMKYMQRQMKKLLSLVCCAAMLLPMLPVARAAESVLFRDSFDSYADQAAVTGVWAQAGNSTANKPLLSQDRAFSAGNSLLLNDNEADKSLQARATVSNSYAKGTEFILTVRYYVESKGTEGVAPYIRLYGSSKELDALTYSTGRWDRLSALYTSVSARERLYVLFVSNSATKAKVYYDDVTVSVLTEALALEYVEEKLAIAGTPDLSAVLTTKALSLANLEPLNMDAYVAELADARKQAGTALTKAQVQACVDGVNAEIQAQVDRAAAEVSKTQTLSVLGDIPVPTVSDSAIVLKWTGVSGDVNNRVQMLDGGPVLISQPAYRANAETVTMTLSITKGSATTTVDVTTTISAYSYTMSQLVEASEQLDITPYLNGQDPSWVVSDLATLPSWVRLGVLSSVSVSWSALNANGLVTTGMMNNSGKVNRGPYETMDTAVILRARLSYLGNSYSRDFHLIVPSLGADEARDLLATDGSFEDAVPTDSTQAPEGWIKHTIWADGANMVETTYAGVDTEMAYCGNQSLSITVDANMVAQYDSDNRRTASVQHDHILTAREGHVYSLQVMTQTRSQTAEPFISLKFLDNEGVVLRQINRKYSAVAAGRGTWANLTASGRAPAGTVMLVAELNGGPGEGVTWFDNVRLRELPSVANGSFDFDDAGWTTTGTVTDGALTLTSGQEAVSAPLQASRGVGFFLSMAAQGNGTMGLRFMDSSKEVLAQYDTKVTTGVNAMCAYAPVNTAYMSTVVTGGSVTVDQVSISQAPGGTAVMDGDFEGSARGFGTPWDLTDAEVGATSGRSGAGLTLSASGSARSAIIPVIDGKSYTFVADVKGEAGAMTIELYKAGDETPDKTVSVTSASDSWNTVRYTFDQLPEVPNGAKSTEHAYARVLLSGQATFDNVAVYSITDSLSNSSVENINNALYGSFPYNWSAYGPVAGFVANQAGQATEGGKSLGVTLFELGQGGVRSSMVRVQSGDDYEASAMVMGEEAALSLEFWNEDFQQLSSRSVDVEADTWTPKTVVATAPEGALYATLSVGGSGVGQAYVDQASITPVVRSIGSNLQLFLDDWLIGERTNVTRTFQPGQKMGKLVTGGWYGNVAWNPDKGLYEMWHQTSQMASYSLMYRTSIDGVNWSAGQMCTSPDVKNSYSLPSPTVFLDLEESDPARRYKLVCYNYDSGGYDLHFSADGITFHRYKTILPGSDVITVTYDPVNREYIANYKYMPSNSNAKRTHSIARSRDLINWSEGVRMYNIGTQADILGTDYMRADSYGTSMYALGDSYVGLNWRFLLNENDGYSGKMDVPLLFSRDITEDWQRMYDANGEPVVAIPRGEEGQWDDAQTYAQSYPIQMGDETWWYYHGWSGDHGVAGVPKTVGISAVKWRRNGFASLDFGTNGTMTTRPFLLAGQGLRLNAKGTLTVELLDRNGTSVAATRFEGDSVDRALGWDKDVSAYVGQPMSLRFTGTDAQLYTLQVEADITVVQTEHGTVSATPTTGLAGTQVTVTATAEEGYECVAILVDGKTIEGNTFLMEGAHTVTARFQPMGAMFYDGMNYPVGGDLYALAPDLYSTVSPAWGHSTHITGTGAGNSGVAIVTDPTNTHNTCLQVTVENNTTSAKRYILVTKPVVEGDYVLEFDYMPASAGTNIGSGFVDVFLSQGKTNVGRIGLGNSVGPRTHFYSSATANSGNMTDPANSAKRYPFADNTWYRVRITVTEEGYTMELWKKGQEATTKGVVTTGTNEVPANTSTNVEFCFGPYNASQVSDMSKPLVNYIDNITITPYTKVTVVQPDKGGSVGVDNAYAKPGQTVQVEAVAQPGSKLVAVLVDGKAISGTSFVMPQRPVTVTASFDTTGQLFYDDMEGYTTDEALPTGTDASWTGEFKKLLGGTYTDLIREDEQGNRYLEMTAANTESSTGLARYWLDTAQSYTGSYIIRMDLAVASDPYYVLDLRLPSVKGADGNELKLRVRGDTAGSSVYFTGSGFATSLRASGDSSSALYVRDTAGNKTLLGLDQWYTLELVVDATSNTITAKVYANGQLVGTRTMPNCTLAETKFRMDHFANSTKTALDTTESDIDNVGVFRRYLVTAAPAENGTITLSRTDGAVGDVVTVTATPQTGFVLDRLLVDGTAIAGSSFVVAGDHTVSAVFVSAVGRPMSGSVAADQVANGGDYRLTGDVTLTGTASLSNGVTIDLDGHTITGLDAIAGTVTIQDSSAGQTGKVMGQLPSQAVIYAGTFENKPAAAQLATDDAYVIRQEADGYRILPGLEERGQFVEFGASLDMGLYLQGSNDINGQGYTFTTSAGTAALTEKNGMLFLTAQGVPAKNMRDKITYTVKKGDVEYYSATMSVYDAAKAWYDAEQDKTSPYAVMLADMLNYGAAAHKQFLGTEVADPALPSTTAPNWAHTSGFGVSNAAWEKKVAYTLSLKEKVELNVYVDAALTPDQITEVKLDGKDYSAYTVTQVANGEKTITRITFGELNVVDAQKPVSFGVELSQTESFQVTYSIKDYVLTTLNGGQSAVVQALQRYVESVTNYISSMS